jgi:hypothetical protein
MAVVRIEKKRKQKQLPTCTNKRREKKEKTNE